MAVEYRAVGELREQAGALQRLPSDLAAHGAAVLLALLIAELEVDARDDACLARLGGGLAEGLEASRPRDGVVALEAERHVVVTVEGSDDVRNSDVTNFDAGFITVAPIEPDYTAAKSSRFNSLIDTFDF